MSLAGQPARRAVRALLALTLALPWTAGTAAAGENLFATVTTRRQERFQQEVFDFTLSVYSRGLTMGREIALANGETPGLRFRPFRELGSTREEIAGKTYEVRRFLGQAQAVATGEAPLRPTARVSVVVPGRAGGARGGQPAGLAEVVHEELHAVAVNLRIRALPEAGRPSGFGGAVGDFAFSAAVRPAAVAEGEPVTLTLEIRGRGNIGSLAAPQVSAGEHFRAYDQRLVGREEGEGGAGGRLVFEQVFVPRSTAARALPAVSFSFFDPERQAYREIVRGPFPLTVRASGRAPASLEVAPPAPSVESRRRQPPAIAPLKPEPGEWLALPVRPWHVSPWFLALQLVPLAAVVAVFLAQRRRNEFARDPAGARRRAAMDAARPGLDAARRALGDGNGAQFYEALSRALFAFFGLRLDLRPGEISLRAVTEGLARAGTDPMVVARLGEVFALLEAERFGGPAAAAALTAHARQRLASLLEEVERLLRACGEGGA